MCNEALLASVRELIASYYQRYGRLPFYILAGAAEYPILCAALRTPDGTAALSVNLTGAPYATDIGTMYVLQVVAASFLEVAGI